jgi:uncharacterized protein YjbJ (UPF0337 family)
MNKNHAKATWNETKGKMKEDFGHATGNDQMAGEGVADQIKGKIQRGIGNVRDAVKKSVDNFLAKDKPRAH